MRMVAGKADQGAAPCRSAILLAAAIMLAPFAARAADLVVWWEVEFFPGGPLFQLALY
jgi:hypothetical protein